MAIPKTIPAGIETVEVLLDEVDEYYRRFHRVRQKLSRFKRGSEPYLDRLPDLDVELFALKLKAEHAHEALEEFEDSLPDD